MEYFLRGSKLVFTLKLFLLNIGVAVIVMRFDSVCYHYLEEPFASFPEFLLMLLMIPVYWGLSLFMFPMLPLALVGTFPWNIIAAALVIATGVRCVWMKDKSLVVRYCVTTASIVINMASLLLFFRSMSV